MCCRNKRINTSLSQYGSMRNNDVQDFRPYQENIKRKWECGLFSILTVAQF